MKIMAVILLVLAVAAAIRGFYEVCRDLHRM